MDVILKTEGLTKIYGETKVVNDVSLTVRQGDIYGFVGKNGAGKTTLIRMILGLTGIDGGSFTMFDGTELSAARRRTGSLVEGPSLYKNMTARDNLLLFSTLLGTDKSKVDALLETVGLPDTGKKKARDFSLGMKQRLGIAMALLGEPDFLILDEPINGLDPKGIVEIRELLLRLKNEGKTIFISSHILGELEKIATRYGIISGGRLVEEITAEELRQICVAATLLQTNQPEKALEIARRFLHSEEISLEKGTVVIRTPIEDIGALTNELFREGVSVKGISSDDNSAEEFFIRKMEEE